MTSNVLAVVVTKKATSVLPSAKPPGDALFDALAADDQVLLNKLLTEPTDYVQNPEFDSPDIETKLFGGVAKYARPKGTRYAEDRDPLMEILSRVGRVPTLTTPQEQMLFMRLNYARMRVSQILTKSCGKQLSPAATRRLLAWGRRALTTRSAIVRLNMPLVLAMAKRTRLSNIDFNEMISEGNMALLRSVEKFDSSRGFKFSTYSCRAILKSFSRVAMRASRYRGQFPTEFDPAMERSDYAERRREGVVKDCVDELKEILLDNVAGLSEVEKTVIHERFAIGKPRIEGVKAAKTLEQVGNIIGVTKERVRQIQNNALKKIRVALEDKFLAA